MFRYRSLTAALLLSLAFTLAASADPLVVPLSPSLEVGMDLQTDPPAGAWAAPAAAAMGGGFVAGSENGYTLSVRPDKKGLYEIQVSRSGERSFLVNLLEVTVRRPIDDVVAVWDTQVPPFGSIFRRVPEMEFQIDVRPNLGLPLVILVDHYGNSRLAAGFVEQTKVYQIGGKRSGTEYLLTMRRPRGDQETPSASYRAGLFLREQRDYWFDAVRNYASLVDGLQDYKPKPIPAFARAPQYCTRYPFSDAITQEVVWNNAVEAARLGFGQILIDVGWSSNKSWSDAGGDYGDYVPASGKFTDFGGMVRRIHDELGMKVTLWCAPTWIGRESKAFEKMKDFRVKWPDGDYDRNLCPRTPEVRRHLAEQFARMVSEYGADGVWLDFLDTFYEVCDAPHRHDPEDFGTALSMLLEDIYQAMSRINPAVTVEYRVPFANLLAKPHANVFETTYSPDDFESNRLMGTWQKAYCEGIVTKSDPVYWQRDAHCEQAARFMMTSIMLGPPAVSGNLIEMSDGHKSQIERWLDYYEDNKAELLAGDFRPFGASFHFPDLKIIGDKKAFIYLASQKSDVIQIERPVQEVHILNSNPPEHGQLRLRIEGLPDGQYTGKYYDCGLRSDREDRFESKHGVMRVSTDMPTGGVLVFTRTR